MTENCGPGDRPGEPDSVTDGEDTQWLTETDTAPPEKKRQRLAELHGFRETGTAFAVIGHLRPSLHTLSVPHSSYWLSFGDCCRVVTVCVCVCASATVCVCVCVCAASVCQSVPVSCVCVCVSDGACGDVPRAPARGAMSVCVCVTGGGRSVWPRARAFVSMCRCMCVCVCARARAGQAVWRTVCGMSALLVRVSAVGNAGWRKF